MKPVREPLRSLLVVAAERAVRDVWVEGHRVVAEGTLTTIDMDAELERLQAAQQKMLAGVPKRDWAGRSAEAIAPMVFETVDSVN